MEIKRRALDTEREVQAEVAFPTGPKGTLRTYDLRAAPQRDGHGRVIGITCVATDVTDRKSIEAALRESEAKYRHIFEGSADGIFVMTDTFRECNDRVCEMWACSRDDVIGHTPAEFSPPLQPSGRPSAEAARDMIEGALAGTPRFFRWTHRRKDGVLIDTEISLKAVSLAGEQVLLATMRDITAQVRREENLAREASENADFAELLTAIVGSTSARKLSNLVIEHAQRITDSEMGFAGYLDPATGHLVVPSINQTTGDGKRFSTGETVFETFHGPWAESLIDRVPALSNAPIQEPAESGGSFGRVPIRRYLSAPAVIGGKLVGLLALANSRRDYSERDLSRVKLLASIYARAIRRLPNDAEDRAAPKAA
jgi:PAS domain S-box-containing protein